VSDDRPPSRPTGSDNRSPARLILLLAVLSASIYLALAFAGDLRQRLPVFFVAHAALLAMMWLTRATISGRRAGFGFVIGAALVFRIVAAFGEPALSDDVYRYVWDGRVQLHGFHPYAHAPDDPALEELREAGWEKINHPQLKTVYPPLAQMLFLTLAALGAGPLGFRLVLGLIDFAVVLALAYLLRKLRLPRDRVVLYAWNPLAVLETAGSGHVEPLGIALVILAAAWIIDRRPGVSTLALGAAVHAKLAPLLLIPGYLRRYRMREVLLLALVLVGLILPYALTGPAVGAGLFAYAERWEFNSSAYSCVETLFQALHTGENLKPAIGWLQGILDLSWIPWDGVYRWAWPPYLARVVVGLALLVWVLRLTFKPGLDAARESFLVLAGLLVLSPTVHPWYVLWVLPFAATYLSWPWLAFAALVVLSYVGQGEALPWWVRWVEYLTLFGLLAGGAVKRRIDRRASRARRS
jgi:hypothetical protein